MIIGLRTLHPYRWKDNTEWGMIGKRVVLRPHSFLHFWREENCILHFQTNSLPIFTHFRLYYISLKILRLHWRCKIPKLLLQINMVLRYSHVACWSQQMNMFHGKAMNIICIHIQMHILAYLLKKRECEEKEEWKRGGESLESPHFTEGPFWSPFTLTPSSSGSGQGQHNDLPSVYTYACVSIYI